MEEPRVPERSWRKFAILSLFSLGLTTAIALRLTRQDVEGGAHRIEAERIVEPEASLPAPVAPGDRPTLAGSSHRESASPGDRAESRDAGALSSPAPGAAFSIRGRAVDDTGVPVARFSIDAARETSQRPGVARGGARVSRSFESQDGRFELGVLADGQWRLTARGVGDRRSSAELVDLPGERGAITLVLPRLGAIAGTVVDHGHLPVAGARVYLLYPGEDYPDFTWGNAPAPRGSTDASGRFRLEDVLPCAVKLMARHDDFADSEWQGAALAPDASLEGIEIQLGAGGRIEGVLDAALGEVAAREVDLYSMRGSIGWRNARTDELGRFVIEHVMPQDYVIELKPPGYPEQGGDRPGIRKQLSVREGETTQVVFGEARREIRVRGTVRSAGIPVAGLAARALSRESPDSGLEAKTGDDGRFELTLSGPGDYSFSLSADYGSYVSFDRTVPDQGVVELSFELPSGALCGEVIGADGRPAAHVSITAVRSGAADTRSFYREHYRRTYTNADGTFEFRLLAPGAYTLRAPDGFQSDRPPPRVPHGRIVLTDLQVASAEVTGIELRLPPEARVAGTVLDGGGRPVTEAWIRLVDANGISLSAVWETRTEATGSFEVENVAPGTYRVRVRAGDRDVSGAPFEVRAGPITVVRVELP